MFTTPVQEGNFANSTNYPNYQSELLLFMVTAANEVVDFVRGGIR